MNSGVLTKANGDEYAGDFVNDLYDGYSLYKYANGDVYCGDFSKGKRHGDGVLKIKEPDQDFAGRFENGHITHGQVKNDEGEYLGEFAPETRLYEGRGIMKFKSGETYDGEWSNGLMHGHGTFTYVDIFADDSEEEEEENKQEVKITANYVGAYVNGKRTEGTLTYENGDKYIGVFNEEGLRESGSLLFLNGDEFAGMFEEGAM